MLPIQIDKQIIHPVYLINKNIMILYIFAVLLSAVIFFSYLLNYKIKKIKISQKEFRKIILYSVIPSAISIVVYYLFLKKITDQYFRIFIQNYEGLYFFSAIAAGMIYLTILVKDAEIDLDKMYEAVFISLISALILGRLFTFLFWDENFEIFKNPFVFFSLFKKGGISVTGGVIGGLLAGFIYAKVKKLHFFYHIQYFIPPILVGQIIGRFGCFLNGDSGGIQTTMPWGIKYAQGSMAYPAMDAIPVPLHPVHLYEIIGNFILLIFMLAAGSKDWITKRRILWYAIGYGIIRCTVEFFRGDTENFNWMPFLSTGQLIALSGIILGSALLIWSVFNDDKLIAKEENIARAK